MVREAQTYLANFPSASFGQLLLDWYDANKRDLPWRKAKDPYHIWVSEVMLQQTQVDTVIPYYERFLARFPTLDDLAEAKEEEVLKQWEGLGYYSRARNLHQAVQEVKERYGGEIPQDPQAIARLKGVGAYTAGAIASIAFGLAEPAVDGNVMRVLSRLLLVEEEIDRPRTRRLFEEIVRPLIPKERAGDFNQALMELGALVCTPKTPQCLTCPVQEVCRAYPAGRQAELPVKGKKRKPKTVHLVAGVVLSGDMVFIRKRPDEGLLAKMYEFPAVEYGDKEPLEAIIAYLHDTYGIEVDGGRQATAVQHTFSHLVWDITVFHFSSPHQVVGEVEVGKDGRWVGVDQLDSYPFPVPHQKIREELLR